jgi:hypothetical protein
MGIDLPTRRGPPRGITPMAMPSSTEESHIRTSMPMGKTFPKRLACSPVPHAHGHDLPHPTDLSPLFLTPMGMTFSNRPPTHYSSRPWASNALHLGDVKLIAT